jgi:hypothetical protein
VGDTAIVGEDSRDNSQSSQIRGGGLNLISEPDAQRLFAPGVANPTLAVSFKADGRQVRAAPRLRLRLTEDEIGRPVHTVVLQHGSGGVTKPSGPLWHGILWGILGGVGGFFAGGYTGYVLDRGPGPPCCGDSPGFAGFLIGSFIGAPVGAFLLAKFGP